MFKLHLDLQGGISCNAFAAALLDMGVMTEEELAKQLSGLRLPVDFALTARKDRDAQGTRLEVAVTGSEGTRQLDITEFTSEIVDYSEKYKKYTYADLAAFVEESDISEIVKNMAADVLEYMARAVSEETEVPFEQTVIASGVTTVIEVVAACVLFCELGADAVTATSCNLGGGRYFDGERYVDVPQNSVLGLLVGMSVYSEGSGLYTTADGAAFLKSILAEVGELSGRLKEYGSGVKGERVLRAYFTDGSGEDERCVQIEADVNSFSGSELKELSEELSDYADNLYFVPIMAQDMTPSYRMVILSKRSRVAEISQIVERTTGRDIDFRYVEKQFKQH